MAKVTYLPPVYNTKKLLEGLAEIRKATEELRIKREEMASNNLQKPFSNTPNN